MKVKFKPSNRLKLNLRRWVKYFYWRFVRLQGTPETIGRGLAVGVFAGMFPLFGLQIMIAVTLAVLVRGHKIIAAAGTWISNPITDVPIFLFNLKVGQWLLGASDLSLSSWNSKSWKELTHFGTEVLGVWFFGCLVVGLVCSVTSYFLGVWLVRWVRTRRWSRRYS